MKYFLLSLSFFLFTVPQAQAYIPRAKTIVKKMTLNNGRREYRVVREVSLESLEKQIKLKETWTIANGDKMKVQVKSLDPNSPWQFAILYNSKNRKTMSASKKVKTFKKSSEFFEPLFHDRYHKSLTRRLVGYRFMPGWVKDTPPPGVNDGKTVMTPEPFIHLEPIEGSVSYAIGADKSSTGGKNPTQLWVEQDSFLIKKGRLGSQSEFVNTGYQRYTGGLRLPSDQTISWNNKVAKIKLLAVERTKTKKKDWSLKDKDSGSIPTDPLIKEFYSRFR